MPTSYSPAAVMMFSLPTHPIAPRRAPLTAPTRPRLPPSPTRPALPRHAPHRTPPGILSSKHTAQDGQGDCAIFTKTLAKVSQDKYGVR